MFDSRIPERGYKRALPPSLFLPLYLTLFSMVPKYPTLYLCLLKKHCQSAYVSNALSTFFDENLKTQNPDFMSSFGRPLSLRPTLGLLLSSLQHQPGRSRTLRICQRSGMAGLLSLHQKHLHTGLFEKVGIPLPCCPATSVFAGTQKSRRISDMTKSERHCSTVLWVGLARYRMI